MHYGETSHVTYVRDESPAEQIRFEASSYE